MATVCKHSGLGRQHGVAFMLLVGGPFPRPLATPEPPSPSPVCRVRSSAAGLALKFCVTRVPETRTVVVHKRLRQHRLRKRHARPGLRRGGLPPPSREELYRSHHLNSSSLFRKVSILATNPGMSRSSHSQTTIAFQPNYRRRWSLTASLSRLPRNLGPQNSCLDLGIRASAQPSCMCQKNPCTKTTLWRLGNTISGFPGSRETCRR